ncbi:MAG: O-antigen ligase family protein [Thainema sp.]
MSYFRLFEKAFAVFGLMYFAGTLDILVPESVLSLMRYTVLLFSIFFIALRFKGAIRSLRKDPFLVVLITLTFASFLWSIAPDSTILSLRSQVIQMIGFGLFFATSFTLKEQLELVAFGLGLSALISTFYAIVQPSIGKHLSGPFAGAWKGVYPQKNVLSRLMVLSCMAFACLNNKNYSKRYLFAFGFYFSLTLVLLSTSKSGLIASIFLVAFLFLYRRFRWRGEISVIAIDLVFLSSVFLVGVIIDNWEPILVGLGRDPTLTGRTLIWNASLDMLFQDRFWLGYGRDAFWNTNLPVEVGQSVARGYVPPHAHNGFIDLMIDLGFIGLFVFALSLIHNFIRAIKKAYAAEQGEDLWPLAFLACLTIANITESTLMLLTNIFFVLYVAIAFSDFAPNQSQTDQESKV